MLNKNGHDDFLVVDRDGMIVYADLGDVQYFDTALEDWQGRHISDVFTDAGDDYPALIAAREGDGIENFKVDITTDKGVKFTKVGSVFPIFKGEKSVASVEFSSIVYEKERVRDILKHKEDSFYRQNGTTYTIDSIKTADKSIIDIKKRIEDFAMSDSSVLIYGKTGTGKELVAQAIHNSSRRYSKKFVSLNCGTIPEGLAEGILFGTKKGSFTGAEDKEGMFEIAAGGTLFLDEINSLKPQVQVKLLRAIESKEIRRLGDTKEKYVDVRIIAATNEDPDDLISNGRMKHDFFHRISAIYLRLPELSERGNDVIFLAEFFIDYFNSKTKSNIKGMDEYVRSLFKIYDWPGNVRELRNVIEGAFTFAEGDVITLDDMPEYIMDRMSEEGLGDVDGIKKAAACSGKLKVELQRLENELIDTAMELSGGVMTEAAAKLGISKQLLKYKTTKKVGIGGGF